MALRDLQGFREPNEAFEKRGFSKGISLVKDALQHIYDVRTEETYGSASKAGTSDDYDADFGKPSGYSY
jgi:hypothetical protein